MDAWSSYCGREPAAIGEAKVIAIREPRDEAPTMSAKAATSPYMDPHETTVRKNQEWFAKLADFKPRVDRLWECEIHSKR